MKMEFLLENKVVKLSEKGWTSHTRWLSLTPHALSYYKDPPSGRKPPKQSVPLTAIKQVRELNSESDEYQVKKLGGSVHLMFAVQFDKRAIVENKVATSVQLQGQPELKSWYFTLPKEEKEQLGNQVWIGRTAFECYKLDPSFVLSKQALAYLGTYPDYVKLTQPKKIDVPVVQESTTIEVMEEELDDGLLQIDEELPESIESEEGEASAKRGLESVALTSCEPSETVPSAPGSPTFMNMPRHKIPYKWDIKFQNLWSMLTAAGSNYPAQIQLTLQTYEFVGQFNKAAGKAAKQIILDIVEGSHRFKALDSLPPRLQVFYDSSEDAFAGQLPVSNSMFYVTDDGMLVKLCRYADLPPKLRVNCIPVWKKYLKSQAAPLKRKQYSRERLSLDTLFEAIYVSGTIESKVRIRVPLTCQVDYIGYRAIVVAIPPIDPEKGLSLGFNQHGHFENTDYLLKNELKYVGDVLNLKESKSQFKLQSHLITKTLKIQQPHHGQPTDNQQSHHGKQEFLSVPISASLKVYPHNGQCFTPPYDKNNRKNLQQAFTLDGPEYFESALYLVKTSDIFPLDIDCHQCSEPEVLLGSQKRCDDFMDTQKTQPTTQELCYFPHTDRVLRPELLSSFKNQVKSDCLKQADPPSIKTKKNPADQVDIDDVTDLIEIGAYLRNEVLPKFVRQLDDLKLIILSSKQLEQLFHSNGINMRLMGLALGLAAQTHVKQLFVIAMLARTAKNIFLAQLSIHDDVCVGKQIVDFLNLMFGNTKESVEFYNEVLFPQTCDYFDITLEDIQAQDIVPVTLYQFFCDCAMVKKEIGRNQSRENSLNLSQKSVLDESGLSNNVSVGDDLFYKRLFMIPQPFNSPELSHQQFKIRVRRKGLLLRTLLVRQIAEQSNEYKQARNIELAVKSCQLRRQFKQIYRGKDSTQALAELAEIALDQGFWQSAINQAKKALKLQHLSALSVGSIQFYLLLMRGYFYGGDLQSAEQYFSKAIAILEYNWGAQHPYQVVIYQTYANLFVQENISDSAMHLYQSALNCCLAVLGENHILTAKVHTDLGKLKVKTGMQLSALQHFRLSFLIYESYYGEDAIDTAKAALQVACIQEDQGKYSEAIEYADFSVKVFRQRYGPLVDMTILASWQRLSLYYRLQDKQTLALAVELYKNLFRQKLFLQEDDEPLAKTEEQEKLVSECARQTKLIKVLTVCCIVMETTRNLQNSDKQKLSDFCKEQVTRNVSSFEIQNQGCFAKPDLLRVETLTNLKFKEQDVETCLQWFAKERRIDQDAKQPTDFGEEMSEGNFHNYFQAKIDEVLGKTKVTGKQKGLNVSPQKYYGAQPDQTKEQFFWDVIQVFKNVNYFNLLTKTNIN